MLGQDLRLRGGAAVTRRPHMHHILNANAAEPPIQQGLHGCAIDNVCEGANQLILATNQGR